MKRLENKVSIVTGATSGIGSAIAKLFAAEGSKVVFTGRRKEQGEQVEKEIRDTGGEALFFQADNTKEEDLKNLVAFTLEKYEKIDVLVNNAGVLTTSEFTELNLDEDFDWIMNVNVKSYMRLMQLVIPVMKENKGGSIINTASIGALQALPFNVTYATSKAAVKHMTESVAAAYAKDNIRVNAILPGLTYSDMVKKGSEFEKIQLPMIPLGRGAEPEEIAHGALFFASDECKFCIGSSLVMDGGALLE